MGPVSPGMVSLISPSYRLESLQWSLWFPSSMPFGVDVKPGRETADEGPFVGHGVEVLELYSVRVSECFYYIGSEVHIWSI